MPVFHFNCKGVPVEFPFEPYECQKDYMSKVVECLQTSKNGILESPTGTGKTVSLLCSTLAWRRSYIASQEYRKCTKDDGSNKEGGYRQELSKELNEGATGSGWGEVQEGNFLDRPRIIYASRTHSQLSQAVDQLKDTAYRPKVSIIGSREQLCIHPEVIKAESNAAKVHMCRAKVDNRMCHFHNNLEHKKGEKAFSEGILDIEDLVKLGNQHKVCPYYMARELKTSADIVFMPYNYLLDPKARRIHGVELSGNVVIFDEAHNVERICEESASFELTSYDISSCIEETDLLIKKSIEIEELNKEFRDDNAAEGEFNAKELCSMKKIFLTIENIIGSITLPSTGSGVTKPGGFIYELFARAEVTFEKKPEILQLLEKMISHLTTSSSIFLNKAAGLQKFNDVINIVFSRDTPAMSGHNQATQMSACYKVHIRANEGNNKKQRTDLWTSTKAPQKKGFVLSYWCFSPGFSMQELVSQGVRSIILTSGTLAPLTSFKSELRIDFPIQLENPHVIERHQMQVGIVTRGPDKTVLNSSYQTRFNRDYILSLGNAIVNFARIVPNGLLVFFPSYPVMNHCLEIWQEDGVSNRISQYKQMFVEPRGKTDFVAAMEGFYEKVKDPTLNGASFFAVCRGKVSEGLDFADMNGRAVVITGLPFPPRMDPRVTLKMQYLDEMRRKDHKYLSGQDWYRQQASRAVNQAIGRVIRHKEDYGAILLCDTRFTSRDSRAQLPLWLRPYVCEYTQFGHAVRDLTSFFKVAEKKMPQPKAKKPRASVPVMYETETNDTNMPGPSNRFPAMKARELDSHVRSLKRNRDGSHVSEAQLKTMYEEARPSTSIRSVGLLDALNHAEISKSSGSGFLFSDALREQTNLKGTTEEPKKRKKIVIKQRGFDSEGDDQAGASSDSSKPARQKHLGDTTMSAQAYIEEVKRTMSKKNYDDFSALIRNYKKISTPLFVPTTRSSLMMSVRLSQARDVGSNQSMQSQERSWRNTRNQQHDLAYPNPVSGKKSDVIQVTVSVVPHKTENGASTKSTSSASITHLNTDSHLNQGRMQATHNASQLGAASVDQGDRQSESNVLVAENNSETKKTESDTGHNDIKSSACGLTANYVSHNTPEISSSNHANAESRSQVIDIRDDSKQSIEGINTPVQSKSSEQTCSKSSEQSGKLGDTNASTSMDGCETDCNELDGTLPQSELDGTNKKEMSEEQPSESKIQKPSESKPPQISSAKIKKKQTSIMDLFKRGPQEQVSTPAKPHKGTQGNAGSERRQKVLRKVLVPETPDKEESEDDQDKCSASQESDISLLSTSSGDLEGYTDVITASVEKLKKKLQGRESGHSEEVRTGDEIHIKKDKKSKRKLSLDGNIDDVPSAPPKMNLPIEPAKDTIGSKCKSKMGETKSDHKEFVKTKFYKKTVTAKSHKETTEDKKKEKEKKKESHTDVHASKYFSQCAASAQSKGHKETNIKDRKHFSKEHVKTDSSKKNKSGKLHHESKEHMKKASNDDISKSYSSETDVTSTKWEIKVKENSKSHAESDKSRVIAEDDKTHVQDNDFCEKASTHERKIKNQRVSEGGHHSATPLHDHRNQGSLKKHKKMKHKHRESSTSSEDKDSAFQDDTVQRKHFDHMANSRVNEEDSENDNDFQGTSKKHKKKKVKRKAKESYM